MKNCSTSSRATKRFPHALPRDGRIVFMTALATIDVVAAFDFAHLGERVFRLLRPTIRTPVHFAVFIRPLGLDVKRKNDLIDIEAQPVILRGRRRATASSARATFPARERATNERATPRDVFNRARSFDD